MGKAGEMGNNVVLLTKPRVSTTWVHIRYQVQAARVGLDIRSIGELAIKTKMASRIATTTIGLLSLVRTREQRVTAEMQL